MYSLASIFRVSCFRHRIVVWTLLAFLFSSWCPSVGMAQQDGGAANDGNIEAIQSLLQQLGYDPGPIDGLMGQKTAAAITAFQTDLNLPVDGEPSAELFAVLQREIAKAAGPTATIRELEGTVLVSGQSVTVGTILIAGDIIETRAGSSAILELSDGSTIELSEKTQLDIADLAQTDTGGRVSRLKLLWGRIRATLSPEHQRADSKFDIETPNALVGVKFSPPRIDLMYDVEKAETVAVATVELVAKNLLTEETVLVPVGSSVVITNTAIELIAGIIEFVTSTDYELPEVRPSGIEDTSAELPAETEEAAETTEIVETETTPAEGTTGLSTGKMIAIGAGALGALGGIALIAGGGDGGGDSDEVSGRCNDTQVSGSDTPETRVIEMGQSSGTFEFYYDTVAVEDRIVVEYEGNVLLDTGCVGQERSVYLSYSGNSTRITVRVTPNCAGGSFTYWEFIVTCPM